MTVVVMAKAPGRAKTRLIPALGAEAVAALAGRMLDHALASARQADIGPVELCADTPHPSLRAAAARYGARLSAQGDGDLGQRMACIAERILATGERLIIVGSDCPELTPAHLRLAARALAGHDAVFQPALDGGYVLIGLNRFHPDLFAAMPWSTAAVMAATRARLRALAWSWWEGETLRDIDTPADLVHLPPAWRPEDQAGMNLSATPLLHQRCPVGGGPSSKTWP